jgi:hypothetical protein
MASPSSSRSAWRATVALLRLPWGRPAGLPDCPSGIQPPSLFSACFGNSHYAIPRKSQQMGHVTALGSSVAGRSVLRSCLPHRVQPSSVFRYLDQLRTRTPRPCVKCGECGGNFKRRGLARGSHVSRRCNRWRAHGPLPSCTTGGTGYRKYLYHWLPCPHDVAAFKLLLHYTFAVLVLAPDLFE